MMFTGNIFWLLIKVAILIGSVVIHEISHAWVAFRSGDPSAKYAGRLGLNPLLHLDPIGSVFLPLFLVFTGAPVLFGWAKPVPYNPGNLNNPKKDSLLVALSGPFSNLLLAVFSALFFHFLKSFYILFVLKSLIVIFLINISLFIFNLLPIPPLDGSKIISFLLPFPYFSYWENLEPYGFFILFLFFLTPAFNNWLSRILVFGIKVFDIPLIF